MNRKSIRAAASSAATAILVMCALVITGLLVRRELAPSPAKELDVHSIDSGLARRLLEGGHLVGPESASLKIVEFGDMQCPFCARAQSLVDSVVSLFDGQVAVVFRQYPLRTIHPLAYDGADGTTERGRFGSWPHRVQVMAARLPDTPTR